MWNIFWNIIWMGKQENINSVYLMALFYQHLNSYQPLSFWGEKNQQQLSQHHIPEHTDLSPPGPNFLKVALLTVLTSSFPIDPFISSPEEHQLLMVPSWLHFRGQMCFSHWLPQSHLSVREARWSTAHQLGHGPDPIHREFLGFKVSF